MAITTMDGLVAAFLPGEDVFKAAFTGEAAGLQAVPNYAAGRPGAMVAPSPGLGGAALTSYAGQIPFPAAVGGENVHLARLEFAQAANVGGVTLMDRLWHNSGFTITQTTAHTINSVAFPARDLDGSTNGRGVQVALEVSSLTGNGAAVTTITMSYTNDANASGHTATMASFPQSAQAGTFVPFVLAAGDTGVRSIQSITFGTSLVSGTVHAVAFREIAALGTPVANVTSSAGPIELGLPRMYDSSVPFFAYNLLGTAVGITNAQVTYAQG